MSDKGDTKEKGKGDSKDDRKKESEEKRRKLDLLAKIAAGKLAARDRVNK